MRAAGQNLKRLLKKRGWGRPFPAEALSASFWNFLRGLLAPNLERRWLLMPIGSASLTTEGDLWRSLLMSLLRTFSTGWI